jgi:hypothetical protein
VLAVRFFARLVLGGVVVALAGLVLVGSALAGAGDPPNLHQGSGGYWVRVAQQDLTDLGYSLPVTGSFGAHTRAEVNAFKRAHRLPADGQLDWPRSWRALRAATRREQSIRERYAHLNSRGLAVAPARAPAVVKRVIAAANRIAFRPYCYGGGHGSWKSPCYDCSGSVSYALHGGGLLWQPMALFYTYGQSGWGKWIRIYTNSQHAYMKIAGLWFDTGDQQWGSYGHGDRWSTKRVDPAAGYIVRHPTDF